MSAEVKRNFLLLGKTGAGKSATGNTLLGQKCFKVSAYKTLGTRDIDFSFAMFHHYRLLVVDGPGLADTELSPTACDYNKDTTRVSAQVEAQRAKELELVAINMDQSLAVCQGGVDAFLLVIKFGSRFTEENVKTLESLKTILGPKYLDHMVVIITGGDLFHDAMEDEDTKCTFLDWCQNQRGVLRELYEKCRGRFVLFNNRTKDAQENRRQILELMRIVDGILDHGSRYYADYFKQVFLKRHNRIAMLRTPLFLPRSQLEHMERKSAAVFGGNYFEYSLESPNLRKKDDSIVPELTSKASLSIKDEADTTEGLKRISIDKDKDTTRIIMKEGRQSEELKNEEDTKHNQESVPYVKRSLTLLLLGKTGHGKSSTGNCILRRSVFKTNSDFEPTPSTVRSAETELDNNTIRVVDGPSIDCADSRPEILPETLTREITKAVAYANSRVDALLLVIRYGTRFTSKDFESLILLEKIFSGEFLKRLIVVVTGGDDFRDCEKYEKCSFEDWCSRQKGAFRELLVTCDDRCVLFDNKEKDEFKRLFQVQELLKVGLNLQQSRGPFLTAHFLKDIQESKTPTIFNLDQHKQWRKEVGTKSSVSSRNEIIEGTSEKLKELALEIEDSQEVKQIWSKIGTGATLAGGALGLVLPVLGALVAATGVISVIAGRRQIDEKIESIKSTQREILRENNLPFETQEAKKTK